MKLNIAIFPVGPKPENPPVVATCEDRDLCEHIDKLVTSDRYIVVTVAPPSVESVLCSECEVE